MKKLKAFQHGDGAHWRDLMRGSIYVMRRINGTMVPLRLENQTRYREWLGCFSAI